MRETTEKTTQMSALSAAVGDVHAGVTGQVLEQQLPDYPESPLAGGLAPHRQLNPIRMIGTSASG